MYLQSICTYIPALAKYYQIEVFPAISYCLYQVWNITHEMYFSVRGIYICGLVNYAISHIASCRIGVHAKNVLLTDAPSSGRPEVVGQNETES